MTSSGDGWSLPWAASDSSPAAERISWPSWKPPEQVDEVLALRLRDHLDALGVLRERGGQLLLVGLDPLGLAELPAQLAVEQELYGRLAGAARGQLGLGLSLCLGGAHRRRAQRGRGVVDLGAGSPCRRPPPRSRGASRSGEERRRGGGNRAA